MTGLTGTEIRLKTKFLHQFNVAFLQRLDLPTSLLRLVLQAEEPIGGVGQIHLVAEDSQQ